MALQSENREYNTFIRGIVTEANPLTFPENASIDEANCVLNKDGSRQRRLGMDLEAGYTATSVTSETSSTVATSCHEWNNAGNSVANRFAVVQVGKKLLVYNAASATISSNLLATIDASSVILDSSKEIQGESGMGFFFFTSGTGDPAVLEYVGGTITLRAISLKVRDYFGVYDGLAVDNRPSSLSDAHKYNLLNQGWTTGKITTTGSPYPSNAQIWFVSKDTNDDYSASKLAKIDFGSSAAPKGRYIISPFTRSADRNSQSGITTATDTETSRPSCVGFANQRVWYAGVEGKAVSLTDTVPNMTGFVFYSRIIRTPQDFGQCHSDTDPTSEIDNEPAEPDGGYLNIPDTGKIYRLIPLEGILLVLAQNGVWAISGGESGFSATQQQVQKLSDFGCISASAVVKTETSVMYWSASGIYLVGGGEGGGMSVQNITKTTVHRLFSEIPKANKEHAIGSYDAINRKVTWLYSSSLSYNGINYKYQYDKELVLDVTLQAFYRNTISTLTGEASPYLAGYITTPDLIDAGTLGSSVTKYLCLWYEDGISYPKVSFGHYKNTDFLDWYSYDGLGNNYLSYMLTGHELVGSLLSTKQAPWLVVFCKRTEQYVVGTDEFGGAEYDKPSSCLVQSRWDWTDSVTSGKWGAEQQAYRFTRPFILPAEGELLDYGHEVIQTKNRLTGRGKSLSLLFSSESGKDMHILGWAIRFTGTTVI